MPVFAFFAAGVTVGGWSGLGASLLDPVTDGVIAGLVIGKPLGVFLTAFLLARFTHASLDDDLAWRTFSACRCSRGIGFTVSLLIGDWRSSTAPRRAMTSRSACWSGPLSQVYWPLWFCSAEMRRIGAFMKSRPPMQITTVCPTSTTLDRTETNSRA